LNELVLSIFWLNGFFLLAADRLTAGGGLTTARWQVLGAVLHEPLTVAAIARDMGLARQSVQRTANLLVDEGLCEYVPNPAHRRAKLLSPTDHGLNSIRQLGPRVTAWSRQVGESVGGDVIDAATVSVRELMSALSRDEAQLLGDD
jgi:DNA-binding MarR family transcriptional regulator